MVHTSLVTLPTPRCHCNSAEHLHCSQPSAANQLAPSETPIIPNMPVALFFQGGDGGSSVGQNKFTGAYISSQLVHIKSQSRSYLHSGSKVPCSAATVLCSEGHARPQA